MKYLLTTLSLLFTFSISSQSRFLDLQYGDQGIATINFEGLNWWLYEFGVGSEGSTFLFNTLIAEQGDSLVVAPFDRKIDPQGNEVFDFQNKVRDTTQTLGIQSFGFPWIDNDKILKYYSDTLNQDTVNYLSRFDLDFNLESSYQIDLPLNVFTGLYHRPQIDNQERLIINDYGIYKRYLTNGSADLSFGEQGSSKIVKANNSTDSLWHLLYNNFIITEQDELIINGYHNIPDNNEDEPWYESYIIKVDEQGKTDLSFGLDGIYQGTEWEFYESMALHGSDGIYVKGVENDLADTLCNPSERYLMKLNDEGEIETSFANSGYLADYEEICNNYNYSFIAGPNNRIAHLQETILEDTTVVYHLAIRLNDGEFDPEFNNGEPLLIDFMPGQFKWEINLDADNNIYLFASDFHHLLSDTIQRNQVHVAKLDAIEVWNLPRFSSPFEPGAVSMFPNPTNDVLTFNYDGPDIGNLNMIIYDVWGRIVMVDSNFQLNRGANPLSLAERFSSGHYFIKILDDQLSQVIYESAFIFIGVD